MRQLLLQVQINARFIIRVRTVIDLIMTNELKAS